MIKIRYLHQVPRGGRVWYYYRRGHNRYPLPAPTDPTFKAEYERVHRSFEIGRAPAVAGSFAKLVEDYKSSPKFLQLAPRTQKDYRRYADSLAAKFGDLLVRSITSKGVMALQTSLQANPRTANYYIQVLRLLLNFAVKQDLIKANPAARPLHIKTGPGHKSWNDLDIAAYREANKHEPRALLALNIGLYTGQREGDCLRMTVNAYDGQVIEVVQSKTGERVWVPVHPDLKSALDAIPKDRLLLLTTKTGRAYKGDFFRHEFRGWADAAVAHGAQKRLTFHGLRKTATEKLLEAGCSTAEVKAITGHRTDAMVSHYGKGANKKVLALQAIARRDAAERKQAKMITGTDGSDNSDGS